MTAKVIQMIRTVRGANPLPRQCSRLKIKRQDAVKKRYRHA